MPEHGIFNQETWSFKRDGNMEFVEAHQYLWFGFFFTMGRAAKVPLRDAIDVVKNFMQHFLTNDLPPYTSEVWKEMSASLKFRWSPHNVYTHVRENRREILTKARDEMGIVVPLDECAYSQNKEHDDSSLLDDNEAENTTLNEQDSSFNITNSTLNFSNTSKFKLILSEENWDKIKPDDASGGRKKPVLKPWVWTNVIAITFWQQHKLNCAFVFKRADVKMSVDNLSYDIIIVGTCKSAACGNKFVGRATKNVNERGGLVMDVETRDTRQEKHEEIKRPFNGKWRKEAEKELMAEGCSQWKKRKAREHMQMGDLAPPFLPSDDVLRQAKKEGVDRELSVRPTDARDLIRTIEELAGTVEYAGLIQGIGSLPFWVFYGTPGQLHIYNEYCRIFKGETVIILDATGSLVTKLIRPDNQKTGHIFLYSVVINFEKTTIPVYQMLSEKHDTEFIQYWLQQWIRSGARKPREAVCDYSRALISAICMAMNNITLKSYINECFASVQGIRKRMESLTTFIRIDVAHLIHMVCRWKSLKFVRQSAIKDFYVRCVALMIDCQTLPDFSEMFLLTCIVGLQEYEDSVIGSLGSGTTKDARKMLEGYISTRSVDVQFQEQKMDIAQHPSAGAQDSSSTGSSRPIEQWVQHQVTLAEEIKCTGVELNPFYLPDFVEQLSKLAMEFPLWTSVTLPYEAPHATSSYVESYFNDLKTRVLKNNTRPLRVDKFLKKHAMDINGGTLLFSSKLIGFEKRGGTVLALPSKDIIEMNDTSLIEPSPIKYVADANDSDLLSQENWRAKGTTHDMMDNESIEDNVPASARLQVLDTIKLDDAVSADDPSESIAENELNWSQGQIERILGPISTLDEVEIDKMLFDHSYSMTSESIIVENSHSESQSNVDDVNKIHVKEEISEVSKAKDTKSKYFKEFPEIRQINLLTRKSKKPSLLLNGSLCRHPAKIDGKTFFVESTCAFDSFISILMTSAIDDIHYASFLERSDNVTLHFVSSLMNNGVTRAILHDRMNILKDFCPQIPTTVTNDRVVSYTINAWTSIANVVEYTMKSTPSVFETHTCLLCPRRQISVPLMTVNHKTIYKQGIGMLEKALSFRSRIYNVRCYESCTGRYILDKTPNVHIFIELDIRNTDSGMPIATHGMSYALRQFPVTLRLALNEELETEYKLVGVVGFRANHFTAYCRRKNGTWQKYDDMQRDISNCNSNTNIEPHLAVYIRQYGEKCDTRECACNS